MLGILCVLPSFGATNPQITKLIKEKQQKYAQLEQCSKKVNGFKIAGISTLGLTAVGIGGNIALASKNKQLDKKINGEGGLRSQLTKEQEKLEKKNAEISAEKLKIQQKQDCDARGDNWEWTVTGCKEKTDNSNSGNSNQNSGGNNQNQVNVSNSSANNVNATVVQSEKPQQETIVDGRIIGSTCVAGDLSSNAASGHYIKLGRGFTKDKDGWDSKRCYSDSKKEQIVDCSCAADSCKDSNYEVSNGICVKSAATTSEETAAKSSETFENLVSGYQTEIDREGQGYIANSLKNGSVFKQGANKDCNITNNGDWCTQFLYFVASGTSTCVLEYSQDSADSVSENQNLDPAATSGNYCYCKRTSLIPREDGKEKVFEESFTPSYWVFRYGYDSIEDCQEKCAHSCAAGLNVSKDLRKIMF